jgi:hypothetical protein
VTKVEISEILTDIHLDVKIPGGVVAYVFNLCGERCVANASSLQQCCDFQHYSMPY